MTTQAGESQQVNYLASLQLFAPHLRGSRIKFVAAVMLAVIAVFLELLPIWAAYRLLSNAIVGELDWPEAIKLVSFTAVATASGFVAMGSALALSHIVAFDVIYRLRSALARHMATLPLGLFATRRSADAKRLIVDGPEQLEAVIAHGLPEGISAVASWIAVSLWLFAMDWRMALATIFVTPISLALLAFATARGGRRMATYQAANARMNAATNEYLAGMPVVKIFNRTGESFKDVSDAVCDYARIETAWGRDYLPMGSTSQTLALANIVFILPVGMILLLAGSLDLGTLLFFVILGATYSQPLLRMFNQLHAIAHISTDAMEIIEFLALTPQADIGKPSSLAHHDVTFERVCFGYEGKEVLREISFTAKTGEVTALIGPSGSGKSTIASLIPRFHDVQHGRITIGGIDVRDMRLEQLMDTVAFVFQDTFLFSETIAANIRFGRAGASDAEVAAAATAARANDFILALPNGYQTVIGASGHRLSGGERQRIAIARAILKDAPVIILDEATAFADPENEALIQDALGALSKGRTLVMVAHRLHTTRFAEQILVVADGSIAECGRHDDLLARNGRYTRLWNDYIDTGTGIARSSDGGIAS